MVDAPDAEDRSSVAHRDSGRVTLVDLLGSRGNDHVTLVFLGKVNDRKVRFFFCWNESQTCAQKCGREKPD